MRGFWFSLMLASLAACVTEQSVEPTAGDAVGSGDSSDGSGGATDTSSSDTTDTTVTADTSVDDTADTSVEDTADTSVEDTADTSVEDTAGGLEACLLACGVGCPAPAFQICGSDGQLYCNTCYMDCYGVQPASQPSVCEPCGVYDEGTAVAFRLWAAPDACFMSFDSGASFGVATSEAELRAMLPCMDTTTPVTGVDWTSEVVVRVVQAYNPSMTVQGVFHTPSGVEVATRSPVYCGGAAPPTAVAFVVVGAGAAGLHQASCIDGECTGGPFP